MPAADPLSHKEIEDRLAELPGWGMSEGETRLERTYRLDHIPAAAFALHIATIQDKLNHHSDLTLGYNTLAVAITTHSAGGRLTAKDFDLARHIADIAPAHGAE